MNTGVWEELYRSKKKPELDPVLTGFNANIDRVIPVTTALLKSPQEHAVEGFDTILFGLKESMRYCSADEMVISDPSLYPALLELFSHSGTLSVGGQAGIAAVHLRRLGVPSVACAVPGAGKMTCALLEEAGITPLVYAPAAAGRADTTHLVFEYPPGLVPPADRVVVRSNRFIVSPLHAPSTVIIPRDAEGSFRERIASCRRAFLSGYQYLRTEQEFMTAARQIRLIRSIHPRMRTHVECVSGADREVMAGMVRHIFPATDSIGLNEHELGLFMQVVQSPVPAGAARVPSSPLTLLRDAIALADATGVPRIHLHTFGYYILILTSPDPHASRNALLLAATVTAGTAGEEHTLSQEGLLAYAAVRKIAGPDEMPGIFRYDDHTVVFIPTYIARRVRRTTGLGDILSSTAFVADPF